MANNPELVFLSGSRGSGVEFIHSILDSHPQVLAIPFPLMFHYFWRLYGHQIPKNLDTLFDLICQETGLAMVLNNYQAPDNAYMLNDGRTSKLLHIDLVLFRQSFKEKLYEKNIDRRNTFMAIYQSYAVAIGQKWSEIRIVLENSHNTFFHNEILEDFPDARFISPLRDPHAIFASCRKGRFGDVYEGLPESSILMHLYQTFINQETYSKILGKQRYLVIKNEEIHAKKEKTIRDLAIWLGIDFKEILMTSTFAGSPWEGNSAYGKKLTPNLKTANVDTTQRWKRELRKREVILVEFLFADFIRSYGYSFYSKWGKTFPPLRYLGFFSFFLPTKNQLKIKGVKFSLKKSMLVKYFEYLFFPFTRFLLFFFYRVTRTYYLKKTDVKQIDPNQNFFPKLKSFFGFV